MCTVISVLMVAPLWLATYVVSTVAIDCLSKEAAQRTKIPAKVDGLDENEIRFRARRRDRVQIDYWVDYTYVVDGSSYTQRHRIPRDQYRSLSVGDEFVVFVSWVDPGDSHPPSHYAARARYVYLYAFLFALLGPFFVDGLIRMFYAKEPEGYVPRELMRDNMWLDVAHSYFVSFQALDLIFAKTKKPKKAQHSFCEGADLAQMRVFLDKLKRVPYADIVEVRDHVGRTIVEVVADDATHTLRFLNASTKSVALRRLRRKLGHLRAEKLSVVSLWYAVRGPLIFILSALVPLISRPPQWAVVMLVSAALVAVCYAVWRVVIREPAIVWQK